MEENLKFIWKRVNNGYTLYLYKDDKVIGEFRTKEHTEDMACFYWFMIDSNEQRKGYGKLILEEVKKSFSRFYPNAKGFLNKGGSSKGLSKVLDEVWEPEWHRIKFLSDEELPEDSPIEDVKIGNIKVPEGITKKDSIWIIKEG